MPIHITPVQNAITLAELDAAMREDTRVVIVGVQRRFRFYETAARLYALNRLNSLAGMLPRSHATARLSERSRDVLFEDRVYKNAVLARIVDLTERDPTFYKAVVDQEGAACLALWKSQVKRDLLGRAIAA